jgi:hypothetical protein
VSKYPHLVNGFTLRAHIYEDQHLLSISDATGSFEFGTEMTAAQARELIEFLREAYEPQTIRQPNKAPTVDLMAELEESLKRAKEKRVTP